MMQGPMMGAPFSFSQRMSCCWQCGEPVSGPDGGQAQCGRCAQMVELKPRASFATPQNTHLGPQHPAMRAQDGKPLVPPPNIMFLWENGGEIPAHRQAEALVAWQGARRRAAAMDVGAGEEICMLTRELASKAEARRDLPRARAMIEAALESVQLPRQRSILLGMMARMAARAGDVQSASAWLSCFEATQDLESESELRVSTAVVATARGDFMAVLNAVGSAFDQIAIQDALDPQAAIFRINALERMGRTAEATQQLRDLFAKGPGMRNAVESIQAQYPSLGLMQQTMPAVQAAHEQAARATAGTGKIGMGCVLIGVSLLPFVIMSGVALYEFLAEGSYEAAIGVPFSLIFVLAFGLWGLRTLRVGLRERRVFAAGVRAQARVIGSAPTGTQINDIPEMRVELEVLLQPPVRTAIRMLVNPGEQHILMPGTMLYVRVDPQHPDVAVLDQ
ncbi:MAG: hypothetical protein KC776_01515 [Myxococcales bacterium]|nr:hypothetical protein [Myxococcales bacterium]MCB9583293.1 hypothetical protein [Polyangiaceae bacterium]